MSVFRWSLATSTVVFRVLLLPPPPLLLGQPTRLQQRQSVSVCRAEWQWRVLCNVLVLLLVAKTQLAMQTVPTRHKQFQRSITVPDDTFRSRFLVRLDTTRYYYCKWSENMKEIYTLGEGWAWTAMLCTLQKHVLCERPFQHTKLYSLSTPSMYLCAADSSNNSAIYSLLEWSPM